MGVAAERFQVTWVSSTEPERLVEAFQGMSTRLAALHGVDARLVGVGE
jgi:F420-non-reducing hydrogenase iron-sulfur subunit